VITTSTSGIYRVVLSGNESGITVFRRKRCTKYPLQA
jgi:hypothetical protein